MNFIIPLLMLLVALAVIYGIAAGLVYLVITWVMMSSDWFGQVNGRVAFVIATFVVGTALMMISGMILSNDD